MASTLQLCNDCGKTFAYTKDLKRHIETYFNDEAMNGKSAHMVFEDYRAGNKTLLNCFKKYPTLYQKYDKLLGILTRIDTLLCTPGEKTKDQQEETAQAMEEFGKFFPVHFKRNLTRKMNILSIVGPRQVRDY